MNWKELCKYVDENRYIVPDEALVGVLGHYGEFDTEIDSLEFIRMKMGSAYPKDIQAVIAHGPSPSYPEPD